MNYKSMKLKLAGSPTETGSFSGHAAAFGNLDRGGDICLPGCFLKCLPDFIAEGIVVWQHDTRTPIGKPTKANEDAAGLYFEAKLSDVQAARDAKTLMADDVIKKMSIGYDIIKADPLDADNLAEYIDVASTPLRELEKAMMWGYALKELKLYEISPVSIPANPMATISGVKGVSHDGMPLEDQVRQALATMTDCTDRLRSLADLRKAEKRVLSEANRQRLGELKKALDNTQNELASFLEKYSEPGTDVQATAKDIFLRMKRNELALGGLI